MRPQFASTPDLFYLQILIANQSKMKAIAISDISGGSAWSSDHSSWHYSSKRSQNMFHPVSLPREEQYTSKPSRVSRSLFGPSDPSESRRLEYEEFNSQRVSDRSRWNFDFHQEKPVSGRYDWRKTVFNSKDTKHGDSTSDFMRSGSKSPKKYSPHEGKSVRLLLRFRRHVDLFILNCITSLLFAIESHLSSYLSCLRRFSCRASFAPKYTCAAA